MAGTLFLLAQKLLIKWWWNWPQEEDKKEVLNERDRFWVLKWNSCKYVFAVHLPELWACQRMKGITAKRKREEKIK